MSNFYKFITAAAVFVSSVIFIDRMILARSPGNTSGAYAVSTDQGELYVGWDDGRITVHDLYTGLFKREFAYLNDDPYDYFDFSVIALSPKGPAAADVDLLDAGGRLLDHNYIINNDGQNMDGACFSPDGKTLYIAGHFEEGDSLYSFDVSRGKLENRTCYITGEDPGSGEVPPQFNSRYSEVRHYLKDKTEIFFKLHDLYALGEKYAAWVRHGRGRDTIVIEIFDTETGAAAGTVSMPYDQIGYGTQLCISPSDRYLAFYYSNYEYRTKVSTNILYVYDLKTRQPVSRRVLKEYISYLNFLTKETLAAGSFNGEIVFYNMRFGSLNRVKIERGPER